MTESETVTIRAQKWPQIVAALSATIGALGLGSGMAWTSPTLPNLVDCENNPDKPDGCSFDHEFTEQEGSWIGSVYTLGCLLSSLVTGLLMAKIGRRWTMILMGIPFIAGWVFLAITLPLNLDEAYFFYIGRFVAGFGGGAISLAAPIYISEVAEPTIRGALGILYQFFVTAGNVFVNAVGSAVSWEIVTAICLIWPTAMTILMFFMPESPYALLRKGKEKESAKSLQWLRGKKYDISSDLDAMKETVKEQESLPQVTIVELLTKPIYLKPFLIMMTLHFIQQFCGINVIVFYLADIFIAAGFDIENSLSSAAIVSLTQVIATGTAVFIVERLGRKLLLMFSSVVMAISIVSLGTFFYLDERKEIICDQTTLVDSSTQSYDLFGGPVNPPEVSTVCTPQDGYSKELMDSIGWLPLTSLIIYKFAFSIGYGPLPWMMNGEFFSLEAKGLSSTLATAFNWLSAFIISKFSVDIEEGVGKSGMYFMFGGVCVLATFFVLFVVPETRGKSPDEMRDMFKPGASRKKKEDKYVKVMSFKTFKDA